MALNSLASRARKRSQVLAPRARLNRRQPHGRTTSGALRTTVLCVEHGLFLRNQRSTQPAALDLKGSDAMTLISTWLHLGHSNSRCSKPIGPGEMRSSIILVRQFEQRRCSISVKDWGDKGTMLPLYRAGALPNLSVADNCLFGRRWSQFAQYTGARLVNIDHY